MYRKTILFFTVLAASCLYAQDTVSLHEVVVDRQLRLYSCTRSILGVSDSLAGNTSLTDLLRGQTPLYFKENGYGMVSSVAFRGTSAQQTAVVWNGLNINSNFTGLTDFNTISIGKFTQVSVRPGGGSLWYGSGAIGGSVHLDDVLDFDRKLKQEMSVSYGSFNTSGWLYGVSGGNKKLAAFASVSGRNSDNDYRADDYRNTNGKYHNTGVDAAAAWRIDRKNTLSVHSSTFDGLRHFSLISPTDTRSKYRDRNTRNLLDWQYRGRHFSSAVKAAYLTEQYAYYQFLDTDVPESGKAETALLKYEAAQEFAGGATLEAVVQYERTKGYGDNVPANRREISSGALLWKQQIGKFGYEAGVRKELTATYDSPLLFSAGASYAVTKAFALKANASRNFRIPTFNDLYWREGGNPELRPENAMQFDVGTSYDSKYLTASAAVFQIDTHDMIQWLPGSGILWHPDNVNRVRSRGAEVFIRAGASWHKWDFSANATYGYTDSRNRNTGKYLIYVPRHRATFSASASRGRFSAMWRASYTGEVFTRTDNNPRYNLDAYAVCDAQASVKIGRAKKLAAGILVRNFLDVRYQVVEGRPFPGTNYQINFNLIL